MKSSRRWRLCPLTVRDSSRQAATASRKSGRCFYHQTVKQSGSNSVAPSAAPTEMYSNHSALGVRHLVSKKLTQILDPLPALSIRHSEGFAVWFHSKASLNEMVGVIPCLWQKQDCNEDDPLPPLQDVGRNMGCNPLLVCFFGTLTGFRHTLVSSA